RDRLAPAWLGAIARRTGTPAAGLSLTFLAAAALLVSDQIYLALNIAVFALVLLYFVHSFALLCLPRANPKLFASVTVKTPRPIQVAAAVLSLVAMGVLIAQQVSEDLATLARLTLAQRIAARSLTALELCALWAAVGAAIYGLARWPRAPER